jgi:hypothetical protein
MTRRGLSAMCHTFDFQAQLAEVQQAGSVADRSLSDNWCIAFDVRHHAPRQFIPLATICVFRVHRLPASALKFSLCDAADKWLRKY